MMRVNSGIEYEKKKEKVEARLSSFMLDATD
jgi:hypothetical protein